MRRSDGRLSRHHLGPGLASQRDGRHAVQSGRHRERWGSTLCLCRFQRRTSRRAHAQRCDGRAHRHYLRATAHSALRSRPPTANGCPGSRAYSIVIAAPACPAITLNPLVLPSSQIGIAYSQAVSCCRRHGSLRLRRDQWRAADRAIAQSIDRGHHRCTHCSGYLQFHGYRDGQRQLSRQPSIHDRGLSGHLSGHHAGARHVTDADCRSPLQPGGYRHWGHGTVYVLTCNGCLACGADARRNGRGSITGLPNASGDVQFHHQRNRRKRLPGRAKLHNDHAQRYRHAGSSPFPRFPSGG